MKQNYVIYTNDDEGVRYFGASTSFEEACRIADGLGGFIIDARNMYVVHDGQFA